MVTTFYVWIVLSGNLHHISSAPLPAAVDLSFGLDGYVELSWKFINQYAYEAVSETPALPTVTVPNVIGPLVTPAISTVRAAGFSVTLASAADPSCNNIGRVMWESPRWAVPGSTITLTVGSRPRTPCP